MKTRGEAIRAFVVAIATALITMLGAVVPQINDSVGAGWIFAIGYSIIFLTSFGLLVTLGNSFVTQYVEASRGLASDQILMESVPTLVRFRSRTDVFTIDPCGRVLLNWEFEVEKGSRQRWTTLEFPILAESKIEGDPSHDEGTVPVDLTSVLVDGEDMTNTAVLRFEERRSLIATNRNLDYGRLSVPVRLEEGRSRAKLEIAVVYDVLCKMNASIDFVIIDVPYVTDDLHVEVRHQDPTCSIAPPVRTSGEVDERPVLATSAVMGFTDSWETELESDNLVAESGHLIWRTHAPKLGYRYKLNFRVVRSQLQSMAVTTEEPVEATEPAVP